MKVLVIHFCEQDMLQRTGSTLLNTMKEEPQVICNMSHHLSRKNVTLNK